MESTNLFITDTYVVDNKIRGIHSNMSIIRPSAGTLFDCYQFTCSEELIVSIVLASGSNLHIQDNHARDYGGGLMIRSQCSRCFIQTSNYITSVSSSENASPKYRRVAIQQALQVTLYMEVI